MDGMVAAVEVTLAVGIAIVAASFVGVVLDRVSDRTLVAGVAVLGVLTGVAGIVLVIGLALDRWSWEQLLVSFAGLAAATAAEAGALGLSRGLRRLRAVEGERTQMLAELDRELELHTQRRLTELERTLARERAETMHLLVEQERELRETRRREAEQEADLAETQLIETVSESQQRIEQRLAAWSADLERAQQQLKARLEELIRQQADALKGHEQRLAEHAAEVVELEEEQHATIARIRVELDRSVAEAAETARAELEVHAADRRRALHEVGERLRSRERAMREQVEREETEVRQQLAQIVEEVERRHLEQLERILDRSVIRLSEDAERRFDVQLRESREKTAERLSRELELSMDTFTRSAEKEVAARITETAQTSAARLQRQIDDVVRTAEAQTTLSNERIQALTERLERSLEAANDRLLNFEAHVELELSTKLTEIERALRAAEQSIERERTA
jgi:hypothetical protein